MCPKGSFLRKVKRLLQISSSSSSSSSGGTSTSGGSSTGGSGTGGTQTGGGTTGAAPMQRLEWKVVVTSPRLGTKMRLESEGRSVKGRITGIDPTTAVVRVEAAFLLRGTNRNASTPPVWASAERVTKVTRRGIVKFAAKQVSAAGQASTPGESIGLWIRASDDGFLTRSTETNRFVYQAR